MMAVTAHTLDSNGARGVAAGLILGPVLLYSGAIAARFAPKD